MEISNTTEITRSDQLQRKMHLTGKVIKTSKAGAIIEIGVEKPALLHISQIVSETKTPFKRVEDVLQSDKSIDVWVRNVRDDRIEVTMKEPLKYEWREIEKDMVVKGKVVEIEKFGAFVDIGAERPGLMHISELARSYVKNTSDVVKVGDEVEVKIIDFNRRKKQIKLSMKALQPEIIPEVKKEEVPAEPQPQEKSRNKRGKPRAEKVIEEKVEEAEPTEPEPTVMEIAWQAAREKANLKKQYEAKTRKPKLASEDQEDILARTLNNRRQ